MRLHIKDFVTLLNPIAGFCSIVMSLNGQIQWGAILIFVAYFFDAIDGSIAKLTRQSNAFGSELDNACDSFSFGIAPAFLSYAAFKGYHEGLGYGVGLWLVLCSTLRIARSNLFKGGIEGYFLGLNRPVLAMLIAAMILSPFFKEYSLYLPGTALIIFLGAMSLSLIPYVNHRQRFSPLMKFLVYGAIAVTLIPAFLFKRPWDGIFIVLVLYTIHPWVWIRGEKKRALMEKINLLKLSFAPPPPETTRES